MIQFPNAKINIGLRVLNKRPDGYHNLESVFYPINLCDVLEIVKADKFSFSQTGIPLNIENEDNIVVKAYQLIKEQYNIGAVAIYLHKVIPTGAGLGGGSSDAVAALKILNELFDLKLTKEQLFNLALKLGSDCPFFIENKPSYVTGRGENIEIIDFSIENSWIKLIHSGIHSSTAQAFKNIKLKELDNNNLIESLTDFKNFNKHFINDFEEGIFGQFPMLAEIKAQLEIEGAFYVSMSGSGTSIYGFFDKKPTQPDSKYFEFIGQL